MGQLIAIEILQLILLVVISRQPDVLKLALVKAQRTYRGTPNR